MKVKATTARTHLLRLITLAHGGKEITITKSGIPIARLEKISVPPQPKRGKKLMD